MGKDGQDHTGGKALRGRAGQAAVAAGAFALGAGATAGAATQLIDGKEIKHGSVQLDALSASARKGLRGPTGPRGPAGPRGRRGPEGPRGARGARGAIGPKGSTGPRGVTGATGTTGLAGATGETGPIGPELITASLGTGSATQQFVSPTSGAVSGGNDVDLPVPAPGFTASSLGVQLSAPDGSTGPLVFRLEGSNSTYLTCTVDIGGQSCSDSGSAVSPPGDELFIRVTCGLPNTKCTIPTLTAGIALGLQPSS